MSSTYLATNGTRIYYDELPPATLPWGWSPSKMPSGGGEYVSMVFPVTFMVYGNPVQVNNYRELHYFIKRLFDA